MVFINTKVKYYMRHRNKINFSKKITLLISFSINAVKGLIALC